MRKILLLCLLFLLASCDVEDDYTPPPKGEVDACKKMEYFKLCLEHHKPKLVGDKIEECEKVATRLAIRKGYIDQGCR